MARMEMRVDWEDRWSDRRAN